MYIIGNRAQARYAYEIINQTHYLNFIVTTTDVDADFRDFVLKTGGRFMDRKDFMDNLKASQRPEVYLAFSKPSERQIWFGRLDHRVNYSSIYHETSSVAKSAKVKKGCMLNAGAVVQPYAVVEECCFLNTNSIVEHNATLKKFVTLAPGATVCGWANIGENVFIGANATILPQITVGPGAMIGAGAVVTKDVKPMAVVKGVPAKER